MGEAIEPSKPDNVAGKRRGILCPGCGVKMKRITHTRNSGAGIVRRYRVCSDCGTHVTTKERIDHITQRGRRNCKPAPADAQSK